MGNKWGIKGECVGNIWGMCGENVEKIIIFVFCYYIALPHIKSGNMFRNDNVLKFLHRDGTTLLQ